MGFSKKGFSKKTEKRMQKVEELTAKGDDASPEERRAAIDEALAAFDGGTEADRDLMKQQLREHFGVKD